MSIKVNKVMNWIVLLDYIALYFNNSFNFVNTKRMRI
jgi:hypothetical protein